MKLIGKKGKQTWLAMAVMAALLGSGYSVQAATTHEHAITESTQFGSRDRSYWKEQGVISGDGEDDNTYTFKEDVVLHPSASTSDIKTWGGHFKGIYKAGWNDSTIDMNGHRLDIDMNYDKPASSVQSPQGLVVDGMGVDTGTLTIKNLGGMTIKANGSWMTNSSTMYGISVVGTNSAGAWDDGLGEAGLIVDNGNNNDWDRAIHFHADEQGDTQVAGGINLRKNTGTFNVEISGLVDIDTGSATALYALGGWSQYFKNAECNAYIGGGKLKSTGTAVDVIGTNVSINSKYQNGGYADSDTQQDVMIDGDISVKDAVSKYNPTDNGRLTLGLNSADSYLKGTIYTGGYDNFTGKDATGDVYLGLKNGATWYNQATGSNHGTALKQFVGGDSQTFTGYIFQKDSGALKLGNYSGYTTIFYAHDNDGTKTSDYTAGNVTIDTAKAGSYITLVTDSVDTNDEATVKAALEALAGKIYYNAIKTGENTLDGQVAIAEGLTSSSNFLKTSNLYFNKETGQGTTVSSTKQTVTDFTDTLTGNKDTDTAYANGGVISEDGTYHFDQASTITSSSNAMNIKKDTAITADKTLNLDVKNVSNGSGHGINISGANAVTIKAGQLKMDLTGSDIDSDGLQGIRTTNRDAKVTIDGNVDITADGDNNTIGIYNRGDVIINGDLKLNIEGHNGGYEYYGATGIYATSSMGSTEGGTVTINGNIDFNGNANGIWANAGGSVVTVKGGSIIVKEGQSAGYAAIKAENGTVNMNVLRDENGNVTGADSNDVTIKGNLSLDTGAINSNDIHGTKTEINLGLSTAKSSLTGVIQNAFGSGKKDKDVTFTGTTNLWLQNGATWNNEIVDTIIENPYAGDTWSGSRVENFVGGTSEKTAGNIFQKDTSYQVDYDDDDNEIKIVNTLTIDNYSGYTNIFYEHTGNGESAENYAAGDTIIKNAAEGSVISLITDQTGISIDSDESVAKVLNALASKLTYSGYANDERNLTGYVKIAEGLTASSNAVKTGNITFSESDGKGSYTKKETPGDQTVTDFKKPINGDPDGSYEGGVYKEGGVYQADGTYKFTKDTTIDASDYTFVFGPTKDVTLDASGRTLTMKIDTASDSEVYGISSKNGTPTVKAKQLVIDVKGEGRTEGIHGGANITGDVVINAYGSGYTLGVYSTGNNTTTIDGNVTMTGLNGKEWGVDNGTVDGSTTHYFSCVGLYAGASYNPTVGGHINVTGDVNLKIKGTGIFANGGGSTVNVAGGGRIETDATNKDVENYAIAAASGNVFLNVTKDEEGNVTGAGTHDVNIRGNIGVLSDSVHSAEPVKTSNIYLGLTTKASTLDGVIVNTYSDKNKKEGWNGYVNMWLQNGATWNNMNEGQTPSIFAGSEVANFVGGSSQETAGNIFQKDTGYQLDYDDDDNEIKIVNTLTIDHYSGYTNIFYEHTGNGESAADYAAGNTIIKEATKDSVVSLITDNTNINMDSSDSVANALNALANKLYYSNYVNGEDNLTGYVKIAEGLTSSSNALKTENITFDSTTGQGSYVKKEEPKPQPKTDFTTTLTGDTDADTEYAGNIENGTYIFGDDSTINATGGTAVDVAKTPLTIDAGDHTLTWKAKGGSFSSVSSIFNQNTAGATTITAGKLVIGADGMSDLYDRSGMVVKKGTVDINAKEVVLNAHYDSVGSQAYGIQATGSGSQVSIHGDLTLNADSFGTVKGLYVEDTSDWNGKGAHITVDGKADINVSNGTALSVYRNGSSITLGGGTIKIGKQTSSETYALLADGGVININMNADKSGAGSVKTVIQGNIKADGVMALAGFDMDNPDSIINLGLAGKDSSWTGAAFVKDEGSTNWPFQGLFNLYLSDDATWNNEVWGKINDKFDGSHVTKFVGGASEAKAGNIFQKDTNAITIDNYSGYANVFYTHTGDGTNASDYAAGDTIIKAAADGSVINIITDNTGISMNDADAVANALNTLAGKLTYSDAVNGKSSLTGYAKIMEGLTSSSNLLKKENIKFNSEDGKGYTKDQGGDTPVDPDQNVFTDAITGEKQSNYAGIQQDDLSYTFTKDENTISINQMTRKEKDPDWEGSYIISGAAIQNGRDVKNLTIDAADKILHLKVALDDKTTPPDKNAGILNNRIPLRGIDNSTAGSTATITAGTLDIQIDNTYSRTTASGNPLIGAGAAYGIYTSSDGEAALTKVKGNTTIWAHGYNNVYGVSANGKSTVELDGDLTMAKNGEDWAIDNVIKGSNTTSLSEASWRNIAGIQAKGNGAKVTVSGKTTIAAHGSGVVALDGATVDLGDASIEVKNNGDETGYSFYALGSALGTINVGGEGKTVSILGNVGLFGKQGQAFSSDSKESVINLKLIGKDSSWTGISFKRFGDDESGYTGALNLTLTDGASWTNEKYGYVYGDNEYGKYQFSGSEVENFIGGASEDKAGSIFQKDTHALTIENYSGYTNIYYAHEGNGEKEENYKAGSTIIKTASSGSVISLITDNTDVDMSNEYSVKAVLNALASKLIYNGAIYDEKDLTGYVKIADGLTASGVIKQTGQIKFDNKTGQGSLDSDTLTPGIDYPSDQQKETFNQAITGVAEDDYLYRQEGVQQKDGKFIFTKNPTTIQVEEGAAVDAKGDINIDSAKSKLVLEGKDAGIRSDGHRVDLVGTAEISGETGIIADNGANILIDAATTITATGKDAIRVGKDSAVSVSAPSDDTVTIKGHVIADGGTVTLMNLKNFKGDVNLSHGGKADLTLDLADAIWTGGLTNTDGTFNLTLSDGATWNVSQISAGSVVNSLTGGKEDKTDKVGNIYQNASEKLTIENYSGYTNVYYAQDSDGKYTAGDTIIKSAAANSQVRLITESNGVDMADETAVRSALNTLAGKIVYSGYVNGEDNLKGLVQIAEGLTSSSRSASYTTTQEGQIAWNKDNGGRGGLAEGDLNPGYEDPVTPSEPTIIKGDYETFVMKGARSAVTTSFHSWRDNMQDTYTGADMADEDGIFAKAYGGKTSSDVGTGDSRVKDSNTYWGAQVGYDKALKNGWHTGVAFDYRDGDSKYLLGGEGNNKLYSFGIYGVKKMEDGSYFRVAAKAGRVENEYDVYTEGKLNQLHADYKANAYGLTAEYGKTFGSDESYITPKAQLTWTRVGSKNYTGTASKNGATMDIYQDSYDSLVGRLGFEAGMKKAKGSYHAGLYVAHEFNGDINTRYFAKDGDWKHTDFSGEDTWAEVVLGGDYQLSKNVQFYGDFTKDLGGDFQKKWKLNAGVRIRF